MSQISTTGCVPKEFNMKKIKAWALASPVAVSVARPVDGSAPLPHCCALCGKTKSELAAGEKLRSCSGCGVARYCSSECQKTAWPGHKKECSGPFSTAAEPPPPPPATAADDGVVVPQGACVICYDEPVSVNLVHANETSHLCVCAACSDLLKADGASCPICRQDIVVHLKTTYAAAQVMH